MQRIDFFYPRNGDKKSLLVSLSQPSTCFEPFQCLGGGREPSQALHLSSRLCLWCEAVAGACVCVPELMAPPAHSRCSLQAQPHKLLPAAFSKPRAAGVVSCDSVSVAAAISGLSQNVAEGWCCTQEGFDFAPARSSSGP